MSKKTIERNLKKALLENGPLVQALFEYELEEHIEDYKLSKLEDKDAFFFAVAEHSNDVAMLLIDQDDRLYINADARAVLQTLWSDVYERNIQKLLPDMVEQLHAGYLYGAGVKISNNPILKTLAALQEKLGKKKIGRGR